MMDIQFSLLLRKRFKRLLQDNSHLLLYLRQPQYRLKSDDSHLAPIAAQAVNLRE